jgi:phage shock protein A
MDVTGLTGDIADLASLRGQVVAAQSTLDALIDATRTIRKWSASLPEKWAEAPFETRALNAQVAAIHEALGTLGGLDDAADSLAAMRTAIREAEGLGERADELGAKGAVQAFTAA